MKKLDNEEINHQLYLLALALTDSAPNAAYLWGRDFLIRKGRQLCNSIGRYRRSTRSNWKRSDMALWGIMCSKFDYSIYNKTVLSLTDLEKRLRDYCHDESCKYIYESPDLHDTCKDLSSDSSMAWDAAECIVRYLDHYEDYKKKENRYKFIKTMVDFLRDNHFTFGDYYKVYVLLDAVEFSMFCDLTDG